MIDLGRAFKAPFEDKEWVTKTLLGFVWGLLVVTAPAIYGAQLEYIRGVSRGDETLPNWDGFGKKWVDGLLVAIAGLLYFLPVVVIGIALVVPFTIAAVSSGESDAAGGFAALLGGSTCLFLIIAIIYSVAVSVLFNAAVTNFAMRENFGAFFEFSAIMEKVRGGTGYFTAWIYAIVISIAASVASSVLTATFVGGILYPAIAYLAAVMTGHVLGQWAASAYGPTLSGSLGAPVGHIPPAPPAPYDTPAPPSPPAAPPTPLEPPSASDAPTPFEPPAPTDDLTGE